MEKREQVELNGLNTSFERLQNDKEILFNLPSNEWKTLNLNFNEHRGRKRKESIEERISKRRGSMLFQCWTKREPEDKAWQVYIEMKERYGGLVNVQEWITKISIGYFGSHTRDPESRLHNPQLLLGFLAPSKLVYDSQLGQFKDMAAWRNGIASDYDHRYWFFGFALEFLTEISLMSELEEDFDHKTAKGLSGNEYHLSFGWVVA
ncbi:hypothetical protein F5878DRAFT_706336 [Lentinula raphanica]|uniref:Uncharacterized protein n=1 Tax=Lentinula raphanica TaxID=153919 RepID=A0AA38PK45_9AGAR|nr:hypothetical protein F5878DRAFT_706336 [Lentinula raphanica]